MNNTFCGKPTQFTFCLLFGGIMSFSTAVRPCSIVGFWDWNAGDPSPPGTAVFEFMPDGNFYSYRDNYWAGLSTSSMN
jgi:hypothetical protein